MSSDLPLPAANPGPAADWEVLVIGGGAAGLMAAAAAASRGRRTLVVEKNRKLGVKILMSGGTRCNITHDCGPREIAARFCHARRFLEFSVGRLPPAAIVRMMHEEAVDTKTESTGKVFPVSDSAVDVRDALVRRATRAGAAFLLGTAVQQLRADGPHGFCCRTPAGELRSQSIILTTGGQSYPGCGTTGDGYAWAEALGHSIVRPRPALVPLVAWPAWIGELAGITLPDCRAVARSASGESVAEDRTSLLFTHRGLSGPLPMNLSRWFTDTGDHRAVALEVDFVPDWNGEQVLAHLRTQCQQHPRQSVSSLEIPHVPRRLFLAWLDQLGIPPDRRLAELARKPLQQLAAWTRRFPVPIAGTLGFPKAEVTAGGIALEEVDNRTMASRIQPGLFLAGEILDFDGPIGGFNFQAAFSTGHLAGLHA